VVISVVPIFTLVGTNLFRWRCAVGAAGAARTRLGEHAAWQGQVNTASENHRVAHLHLSQGTRIYMEREAPGFYGGTRISS